MIEQISKYHGEWVLYVGKICGYYAEDIVQEMYLKVGVKQYPKCINKGKVNKPYILSMLRSMVMDYHRAKKKVVKVDYLDVFEGNFKHEEGLCLKELEERHETHLEVCKKLRGVHGYYERFYMIYTSGDNPSLQDVADASGMSKSTIHTLLKNTKQIIKNGEITK